MGWQELTLIGMFLFSMLYVATLYHLAHGRETKAMEMGARVVIDALTRDGRIMPESVSIFPGEEGPVNLDEEQVMPMFEAEEPGGLPEILIARSNRAAKQMADNLGNFNEKV